MSALDAPVDLVAPLACEVGENPLWHSEAETLFFLDITLGTVYAYHPATQNCSVVARTRITGGFTLQRDGSLLLFQDGRIAVLTRNGVLREVASGLCPGNDRFNDVIADPEGRVFAGAMGGNGKLLRFDPDGTVTEMADGLSIPNGMGFTPDLRGMYFTDSLPRKIYYFDYDRKTGNLSNRRIFAEIPPEEGLPDGMTIDRYGYVWSAIWFGGRVKRYAPDGRLDREVFLPIKQTSAVTFGGPDLTDMYVTSAAIISGPELRPPGFDGSAPRGGGLYRLRLANIGGSASFRSHLPFS
jgi:D-xylono/L-arabinono-1,4-lactonase